MGNLGQYVDGGIDVNQYEERDFDPLPAGWYPFEIEKAEVAPTQSGGQQLKVQLSVLSGKGTGRKVFDDIQIVNASEKAQQIGRQQLADLARATGIPMLTDEDHLLGKHVMGRVKITKDEGYAPRNEINGYKAMEAAAVQTQPPVQQQPQAVQQAPVQQMASQTQQPAQQVMQGQPTFQQQPVYQQQPQPPVQQAPPPQQPPAAGAMPWER